MDNYRNLFETKKHSFVLKLLLVPTSKYEILNVHMSVCVPEIKLPQISAKMLVGHIRIN